MEKLTEEDLVIDIAERDKLEREGETRVHELREEIRYEYPECIHYFHVYYSLIIE